MLFKYQMAQYISNNKHITHIEKYVKNCRFYHRFFVYFNEGLVIIVSETGSSSTR